MQGRLRAPSRPAARRTRPARWPTAPTPSRSGRPIRRGNTDPTPASRTFTVDTTPPETTIDSGPSGTTNDPTPTFGFSSSEPGSSFECRVDCGRLRGLQLAADRPARSPTGPTRFSVRATDSAGNTDATPASRTFTVDATPPADDDRLRALGDDQRPDPDLRLLLLRAGLELLSAGSTRAPMRPVSPGIRPRTSPTAPIPSRSGPRTRSATPISPRRAAASRSIRRRRISRSPLGG